MWPYVCQILFNSCSNLPLLCDSYVCKKRLTILKEVGTSEHRVLRIGSTRWMTQIPKNCPGPLPNCKSRPAGSQFDIFRLKTQIWGCVCVCVCARVCVCVCMCGWPMCTHMIYARMYGMNTHVYIVRFGARLPLLPRKRESVLSDAKIERAND